MLFSDKTDFVRESVVMLEDRVWPQRVEIFGSCHPVPSYCLYQKLFGIDRVDLPHSRLCCSTSKAIFLHFLQSVAPFRHANRFITNTKNYMYLIHFLDYIQYINPLPCLDYKFVFVCGRMLGLCIFPDLMSA